MKKMAALTVSLLFSGIVNASDCFDFAGRDYKIDPDLLRAIAWNESRFNMSAIGTNKDGSIDMSLMQINSQHIPKLAAMGISRKTLMTDACMNIYTGAYFLAVAFNKWGIGWHAVGAYNAGFKESEKQAQRRYTYAKKIEATYRAIKESKKNFNLQNNQNRRD